jgi:putative ABC transport system permease protein
MNVRSVLRDGVSSLRANKTRSYLSVFGVVFGVAAVVAMLSVVEGARNDVLLRLARLGSNVVFVLHSPTSSTDGERVSLRPLQLQDADRILQMHDAVQAIAPLSIVSTHDESNTVVAGVTQDYAFVRQLTLQSGRFISALDTANQSRVCVVGPEVLMQSETVGVGSAITLDGSTFTVVGVLTSEESVRDQSLSSLIRNHNNFALIPITSMRVSEAMPHKAIPLTELSVRMKDARDVTHATQAIENILQKSVVIPPSFSVVVPRHLLRQEQHTQQIFAIVIGCVALIGVLVGGVGVMNIMFANVAERWHEIGIRRAIGATKKQIATLFLTESVLLTLLGGLGGVVFGVVGAVAIALIGNWPVSITLWSIIVALAMAITIGVLAGYYPAMRAARLHPVDALRHE